MEAFQSVADIYPLFFVVITLAICALLINRI